MKHRLVRNAAQGILLSSLFAFALACGYSHNYTQPTPGTMPAISQLTPASGTADNAVALEVDGSHFNVDAVINFNGTAMTTTYVSTGKLTATVPATAVMNTGTVPVTVTNPGTKGGQYGGGTQPETSAAVNFTVN